MNRKRQRTEVNQPLSSPAAPPVISTTTNEISSSVQTTHTHTLRSLSCLFRQHAELMSNQSDLLEGMSDAGTQEEVPNAIKAVEIGKLVYVYAHFSFFLFPTVTHILFYFIYIRVIWMWIPDIHSFIHLFLSRWTQFDYKKMNANRLIMIE